MIGKYEKEVEKLNAFMKSQGLECKPEEVSNLNGPAVKAVFIERFKEVQRLKTQLDQYTDLTEENKSKIDALLPQEQFRSFKAWYLEKAKELKKIQDKEGDKTDTKVQQLDFEFVLFASTLVDYDYIMALIARNTQRKPAKEKMTKEQLINLISSSANLMEERDDIAAYIHTLKMDEGLSKEEIEDGYKKFKEEKSAKEVADIAEKHGLETAALKKFVDDIKDRMIFDGEKLGDLLAPLQLGWKDRTNKELALMQELSPLLKRIAQGREISGLSAYE